MKLADQWAAVEAGLAADWADVRLTLTTEQPGDLARAAQALAPMSPGRTGDRLVVTVRRAGGASGPEGARRLFSLLDRERVWATIEPGAASTAAPPAAAATPSSLTAQWDALLATLPADWSDLLCEIDIGSTELLPRAALDCAPLNPTRDHDIVGFVFRCARVAGYGVSPAMARRCFERLDADAIAGSVGLRRVLSETGHVATQGPVWLAGGRAL